MNKLKTLLEELERAEIESNEASEAWGEEPENRDLETLFDESYKRECDLFNQCVDELQNLIKINKFTAQLMVKTKRAEIQELIAKAEG